MRSENASSAEEMAAIGARFAKVAKPGSTYALIGGLGAGKTQWSQGFIKTIDPKSEPSSPTFSIVNEYRDGPIPIFHFDFYRTKNESELLELGWDEYIDERGILICEWANLFPKIMPQDTVWLEINQLSETERTITTVPPAQQN